MVTKTRQDFRKALATNRGRAKDMRRKPVAMEKLFWSLVRNRKLDGFKFKRQVPIGPFIVDFLCAEKKLVVELDGALHAGRMGYDADRDRYLEKQGYTVLRFENGDFADAAGAVLAAVRHVLVSGTPSPCPLPREAGEREQGG